jgi:glycerol uptake facilitator protein
MNPARDFGPRLAHTLLPVSGKGRSDWGYALVPIAGPLIAGGIGAAIIKAAGIS